MTAPMTEEAIARVEGAVSNPDFPDRVVTMHGLRLNASDLRVLLSLARQGLEMREALKPFASEELFQMVERKAIRDGSRFGDASCVSYPTTLGSLRAARAALQGSR